MNHAITVQCPIFIFVQGSTCKSNVSFAHCASSALSFVATASRFLFSPVACSTKLQVTNAASKQQPMIYSIYKSKLALSTLSFFSQVNFIYIYMHAPAIKSSFIGRCWDAEISWRPIHIYPLKGTFHDSTASCGCNLVKSLDQTFWSSIIWKKHIWFNGFGVGVAGSTCFSSLATVLWLKLSKPTI